MEAQVLNRKIINFLSVSNDLERQLLIVLTYNKINDETVTNIVALLADLEEVKNELISVIPRPSIDYMASIAEIWFDNSSEREKAEFCSTEFSDLVIFMHTLGALIINNFRLWTYIRIPESMDDSEEHPEYVALRVIEELWRRVSKYGT